jgi:CelD/BcsL family acetyltransferase involved in cellulose biosynthesis
VIRPISLATRGRVRLHAEVLDGLAQIKASAAALQSLAVRCDAPVTACLPWVLASAEAALALATTDRCWALVLRDDDGEARAAAVLLETWTPSGPALRLAGAEGGYRTALLSVDGDAAGALAEALVALVQDRVGSFGLALGPVDLTDPVVERMSMALSDWVLDGSSEVPVVRRAGPPEATEYLSPSVRRTLRKVRNRLHTDGIDAQVSFTRERHRILRLLPGMALAYHDRDAAHGLPGQGETNDYDMDDTPGWPLFAARVKALAGQGGMEVATLHFDGELAAYVVGFDDGHAYRVMDGRFISSWARYSPGRLLETAVLQRMIDDPSKQTLDWMTSIAPESLLVANQVERVVTMRARVEPFDARRNA